MIWKRADDVSVAVPVQAVAPPTVNVLTLAPPVSVAISIPDNVMVGPPVAVSDVLVNVKLAAFLVSTTVSPVVCVLPVSVPEPVQPVMVNVLSAAPPVRLATSILVRLIVGLPEYKSEEFVRVKSEFWVVAIVSVPVPPMIFSVGTPAVELSVSVSPPVPK